MAFFDFTRRNMITSHSDMHEEQLLAEQELAEIRRRLNDQRKVGEVTDAPPLLYHYTSSDGLLGILESNELSATHIYYLNDSNEAIYGLQIFEDVISARLRAGVSTLIDEWLEWLKIGFRFSSESDDVYVVCFCEQGNLLSHWRAYAAEGKGFSLGFRSKDLVLSPVQPDSGPERESTPRSWYLTKVEYRRDVQEQLVNAALNEIIPWFERWSAQAPANSLRYRAGANAYLGNAFSYYITQFKSEVFREEQEWRYVYHRPAILNTMQGFYPDLRHSPKADIVPYVRLRLRKQGETLPLEKALFGPRLHPFLTTKVIRMALERQGLSNVSVEGSGISLRW